MAVVPEVLNRWRGGLLGQTFLYVELLLLMALVFSSCSSSNRCSTNQLEPEESFFSSNFGEGKEFQIETFKGFWDPFQIKLWKKQENLYTMEFVNRFSTLQMNVRNTGKILLREELQINFHRNEMMIFAFKIGESGAWVVEVRKGDFMRAVQLTDVSLDEVDDIEVYNEQSSVNRKVRFCNAAFPVPTEAQDTTTSPFSQTCHEKEPCPECKSCPVCQACPEKAPCPECEEVCSTYQADYKCSSSNRCSTNQLKPNEGIISSNFAEGKELQIETFKGVWNPFQIKLWKKQENLYTLKFVNRFSTFQMNVRNAGKILLREELQIDFGRNEMMIFAFKIGESGAWVVEVRKGDFMRAVQLTDVSLDEVDDIEVYNEGRSRNRKVLFCNAEAQDTTISPFCQTCHEKEPCPECEEVFSTYQADYKCEVCTPVTASSPAGTSSQTTDHRAEPTSETVTCLPCDIFPSTVATTLCPVLPTGPVAVTCPKCPKCDACHSDISSSVSESAQIGVDKNSRTVQEAELVTDEATVLYSNGEKGCMESNTKILLYILMTAFALSTLAMVLSTALACKYKRKLLLSKTRTKQAESVRWNPNQPPSVLGEETQSLESPQDNRDSIYYHVYEDPYKYAGQPNNHQQCNDSPSAIKGSPRNGSETESIPCSFRCVSPPDDTIYDHLQF